MIGGYMRYRAVWHDEDGVAQLGELTNYQNALNQVLEKRGKNFFAYLEDEFNNRIEGV